MKVGVITFHNAHNFGASLQTWALQKVLKKYDLDSYVIHYHPAVIDNLYDPIKCTGIKRCIRIVTLKRKHKNKLTRFLNYQKFIRTQFKLLGDYTNYEKLRGANLCLDAYITGSDQIWNHQHTDGFDPAYFLDFAEEQSLKLSYGASIGKDYLPAKYIENIKNSLSRFHFISVREESAVSAIQALTNTKTEVVLDPTLLLTKEDYSELIQKPQIQEKYIFVYMMEKNKEVILFANQIAKALGFPIIHRHQQKIFKNEIASCYTGIPGDFLGLIEQAELVITNSFHGTVFSIIYGTPFFSLLHSVTGSRTIDLLNSLDLSSHIITGKNEFYDLEKAQISDLPQLKKRIEKLKIHSLNFLEEALSLNEKSKLVACPTAIRKEECYGCFACKEICPVHAITMEADTEGFLYPVTDQTKCTNCDLCNKICIQKNTNIIDYHKPFPLVYSAMLKDTETRLKSSSGALFPALANYAIDQNGYVAGVKFNSEIKAVSVIVSQKEELIPLYGSKYVKSDFDGIFPKIKELLLQGKFVLYSGLPCECAGLRAYLIKDYENLFICEILCHSAPSPKVLKKYINYLNKKFQSKVSHLEFRNKSTGWETHKCTMLVQFENGHEIRSNARKNNYFRAFQNNLISRNSCANCHYVFDKRAGDITIGDFWGIKEINPEMYDEKGTSLVMLNTEKAMSVWNEIKDQFIFQESTLQKAFQKNHKHPIKKKLERMDFFCSLDTEKINPLLKSYNDLKK